MLTRGIRSTLGIRSSERENPQQSTVKELLATKKKEQKEKLGETLKMALGVQMDASRTSSRTWLPSRAEPRADPRHQAETSEPC